MHTVAGCFDTLEQQAESSALFGRCKTCRLFGTGVSVSRCWRAAADLIINAWPGDGGWPGPMSRPRAMPSVSTVRCSLLAALAVHRVPPAASGQPRPTQANPRAATTPRPVTSPWLRAPWRPNQPTSSALGAVLFLDEPVEWKKPARRVLTAGDRGDRRGPGNAASLAGAWMWDGLPSPETKAAAPPCHNTALGTNEARNFVGASWCCPSIAGRTPLRPARHGGPIWTAQRAQVGPSPPAHGAGLVPSPTLWPKKTSRQHPRPPPSHAPGCVRPHPTPSTRQETRHRWGSPPKTSDTSTHLFLTLSTRQALCGPRPPPPHPPAHPRPNLIDDDRRLARRSLKVRTCTNTNVRFKADASHRPSRYTPSIAIYYLLLSKLNSHLSLPSHRTPQADPRGEHP